MELIDRNKLLLYLNDIWYANTPNDTDSKSTQKRKRCFCAGIRRAMSAIEEAETVQTVNEEEKDNVHDNL